MSREYLNQNNQINPFLSTSPKLYRESFATILVKLANVWMSRRATRKHLGRLTDHELKDIGLTREQALTEATKPFWRG
ncbi:hypothetical protein ACMU_07275 [Actibacterium mucosum KCTC 23349]|uniref:YjiS-like domain-containing protein n=1 Tax=Actibacterium mucosum KCTC 23349 TaxID=1454373 RepID=A0A037ZMF1_9RHOB|nr:DUF1127 domain-containing protein [Actibacterium mucosum]KAJ56732.1 hypothetical protein ACMU_07275 [Actibacterium mucosum KCTC 23349]